MKALVLLASVAVLSGCVATKSTAGTCDAWGNPKDSNGNPCSNTNGAVATPVGSNERQIVDTEERQLAGSQAAARDQSVACLGQLRDDPKFRLLYAKLPFDVSAKSQPLEVLANKTKPTPKEKAALSAYSSEKERCLDIGNEWRRQTFPPEANALYSAYRTESVAVLTDLYAGKIAFGEAVKLRVSQESTFSHDLDTLRRKYQAQSEAYERQRLNDEAIARAQKEAAEQQQAQNKAREQEIENQRWAQQQAQERAYQQARKDQANQQFMQGLMLLDAARPRPAPMMLSPSVNCTSRAVGNTVQTNCF